MGYRLLAADVDGTLAPMGASVSETTVRWISQAFRQGKTVTLATGRLPAAAERFRPPAPRAGAAYSGEWGGADGLLHGEDSL